LNTIFRHFSRVFTINLCVVNGTLQRATNLPASFIVVDGIQVIYETTNFTNPEQFAIAIAHYDDAYLAQQFIKYYQSLSKDAPTAKLLQRARQL
jgi:hypothetical protein